MVVRRLWLAAAIVVMVPGVSSSAEITVLERVSQLAAVDLDASPAVEAVVTLHARWTLDCGDDPQFMLGVVNQAAVAPDGTILLVDRPLGHVLLAGPDGDCLGVRGSVGDGPGELRGLFCAAGLADGRVVLSEGLPPEVFGTGAGKLAILDAEGVPVGGFDLQDPTLGNVFPTLRGLRAADGMLLVGLQSTTVRPPRVTSVSRLLLTDLDGAVVAVLGDRRAESSFLDTEIREADVFEPYTLERFDIASDGRVAFAPERDAYVVAVVDPRTGTGVRLVRAVTGRPRTDEERATLARVNGGDGIAYVPCETEPVVHGLRFRPDGCLWVALGRDAGAPADEFGTFDEIGPDGAWRRRVRVRAPGDADADRLIILADGRFVLVRGLEAEDTGEEGISVTMLAE